MGTHGPHSSQPLTVRVGIMTAPHIEWERHGDTFLLHKVRIGIGFHWDRYEDQEFSGQLDILHNADGTETAVNTLPIEDYLCSVISSEMSADSPIELLKAHAVISRSWLMRALGHTGHVGFDVCADDHCQRYEGLRRMNSRAVEAVRATTGQVLMYEGEICDCRYHKCCGGRTEVFATCWEDKDVPYLPSVECPYCAQYAITDTPSSMLNDYDRETTDFHDWQVRYSDRELHDILLHKSGIDFGDIVEMTPVKRGLSGRIYALRIVGTLHTETIGKELTIRQWLSPTCLYSSWFDIIRPANSAEWLLVGHGWGHGVGLCQIGAAVMAQQGATYRDILAHYYLGSISKG